MTATPQQLSVVARTKEGASLSVGACAGSGKTSTAVLAAEAFGERMVTATAFNRRNAEDLLHKMPPWVTCKTFNSLGLQSWAKRVNGAKTDPKKAFRIRDSVGVEYRQWPEFARALNMIRELGFVPDGPLAMEPARVPSPWSTDELIHAVDAFNLWPDLPSSSEWVIKTLHRALTRSIELAFKGDIDFADQLYMPTCFDGSWQRPELLIVDEVQDVSTIQRHMIDCIRKDPYLQQGAQVLALGDPHQAIYAFRGADSNSFSAFQKEFGCEFLPLTVSFRCPKAVTAEAQVFYPEMESHPKAPEGLVQHLGHDWDEHTFQEGDVILCRYNRPLIPLAMSLLRAQIPAKILGRDLGVGLKKLLKKTKAQRTAVISQELDAHRKNQCALLQAKGRFGAAAALEDQCLSLIALCDSMGDRPRAELERLIDKLFSESAAPITLSTVHKAKGLEWPRVFFLDRDLIPSRWAESPEDYQQEDNIAYVGITRAQRELYYIRSQDR